MHAAFELQQILACVITTNVVVVVVTNLSWYNNITILVRENSWNSGSKIAMVIVRIICIRCIRESQNFSPGSVPQVWSVKRVDEDIQ